MASCVELVLSFCLSHAVVAVLWYYLSGLFIWDMGRLDLVLLVFSTRGTQNKAALNAAVSIES